jgi:hypothetical protein
MLVKCEVPCCSSSRNTRFVVLRYVFWVGRYSRCDMPLSFKAALGGYE